MTHDGLALYVKRNLKYANTKTMLGYIGTLDANHRRPPAVYSFDLSLLPRQGKRSLAEKQFASLACWCILHMEKPRRFHRSPRRGQGNGHPDRNMVAHNAFDGKPDARL
jgi:hypothetical protein